MEIYYFLIKRRLFKVKYHLKPIKTILIKFKLYIEKDKIKNLIIIKIRY